MGGELGLNLSEFLALALLLACLNLTLCTLVLEYLSLLLVLIIDDGGGKLLVKMTFCSSKVYS